MDCPVKHITMLSRLSAYKVLLPLILLCLILPAKALELKITGTNDGISNGDKFGRSVVSLGDLDQDGWTDIAIGTQGHAVWVMFLNSDGTVKKEQQISPDSGGFNGTSFSGNTQVLFGSAIANLGDIDGDGVVDILVGDPGDIGDKGVNKGAAYVLFLNNNGTVKSQQKLSSTEGNLQDSLATIGSGITDQDFFGMSAASLGHLNGDDPTVAVGAPYDGSGACYVLFLNIDGTVKQSQKIIRDDAETAGRAWFGVSIASLGDLDGDGFTDMVVGSYQDSVVISSDYNGAVFVCLLNGDGSMKFNQKINSIEGGLMATLDPGDFFGTSVASIGDIDGDNIVDIVVSAYNDDKRGALYVINLYSDGKVKSEQKISHMQGGLMTSLEDNDHFGTAVTFIGDIMGKTAIAVGAYYDSTEGALRGAAYILTLTTHGFIDTCTPSPPLECQNEVAACTFDNATLFDGNTSTINNARICDCTNTGYAGTYCETDVDDCVSNPCLNNATCIDDGSVPNSFQCTCLLGYNGTLCADDINDCASNPCMMGTCSDDGSMPNSFNCSCDAGYEGVVCDENMDDCVSSPCMMGNCTDGIEAFVCDCAFGYTGVNCATEIDYCISSPCVNGTCVSSVASNDVECECNAGHVGDSCENPLDTSTSVQLEMVLDAHIFASPEDAQLQILAFVYAISEAESGQVKVDIEVVEDSTDDSLVFIATIEVYATEDVDSDTIANAIVTSEDDERFEEVQYIGHSETVIQSGPSDNTILIVSLSVLGVVLILGLACILMYNKKQKRTFVGKAHTMNMPA